MSLRERFARAVTTHEELRAVVGQPGEPALKEQITRMDAHCTALLARSPFVLVGTCGEDGRCDVSPRGDAPGFALVLDDQTLVLPERPGNRRVDTLTNVLHNPHLGLLVLIPGVEETLRVNGGALIVRDQPLLDRMAVNGKPPQLGLAVEVQEAYLHCAQSFKRPRLWQGDFKIDRRALPSLARMVADQTNQQDCDIEAWEAALEKDYAKLY